MNNDPQQLDKDLLALMIMFWGANVRGLLEEPSRLENLARMAGVPQERLPAIREALRRADEFGLA